MLLNEFLKEHRSV